MDGKFIVNEINKWEKERLISSEQAAVLKTRYGEKSKKNTAAAVFSIVGALFITIGSAVIIAAGWKNISQSVRAALSFAPLISAQFLALFSLIKNKNSFQWRESASVFYTAAIFISFKLVEYVFNVPTDYTRYIICCGITILPVAAIFRSVLSGAAYIFTVLNWGYLIVDSASGAAKTAFAFALMLALTVVGIIFLLTITKNEDGILRVLAVWFSAAAVFAVILIFSVLTKSNAAVALLLLFAALYAAGKKEDKIYSPFIGAGVSGSFVMLALFSFGIISPEFKSFSFINFSLPIFLIIFLTASLILSREYNARKLSIVLAAAVSAVLITLFDAFAGAKEYPEWGTAIISMFFLFVSVVFIANGARYGRLSDINLGLISFFSVIFAFLENEMHSFTKGIFLFVLGLIFLTVNLVLSKRFKKNNDGDKNIEEVEVSCSEKQ